MTQPGPLSPRTLALKHSEPRVEVGGADASLPPRPEARWFVLLPGAPACQRPLHSLVCTAARSPSVSASSSSMEPVVWLFFGSMSSSIICFDPLAQ